MTVQVRNSERPAPNGPALYPWRAYFLGQLLYIFLNVREMSAWTKPVWAILAFLMIPALCTLVIGRGGTAGSATAGILRVGGDRDGSVHSRQSAAPA